MKEISIITNLSLKEVENKLIYTFNYKRFETVEFIRLKNTYILRNRCERDPLTKLKLINIFDLFGIEVDLISHKTKTAIHLHLKTNNYFNLPTIFILPLMWLVGGLILLHFSLTIVLIYFLLAGFISFYFIFKAHKASKQQKIIVQKIKQLFIPFNETYIKTKAFEKLLMN
jgi:hypothetical protein